MTASSSTMSRSSSRETKEDDSYALDVLTDMTAAQSLTDDVDTTAYTCTSHRFVGIHMSRDAHALLRAYAVLRPRMTAAVAAAAVISPPRRALLQQQQHDDADGAPHAHSRAPVGGGDGGCCFARWLLLLAFVIRACPAHYTAWADRRAVLLTPACMRRATTAQLCATLSASTSLLARQPRQQQRLHAIASLWLPSAPSFSSSSSCVRVADDTSVAEVWRAVRWELRIAARFVHLGHKNFQVWHHRRELLTRALRTLPRGDVDVGNDNATHTAAAASPPPPLLHSAAAVSSWLSRHVDADMCIADVDERMLVDQVLFGLDAKNYHAWLHRAWFVHAFAFCVALPALSTLLAQMPPTSPPSCAFARLDDDDDVDVDANHSGDNDGDVHGEASATCHCSLLERLLRQPSLRCAWADEVYVTTRLLACDGYNNSAWCHRYALLHGDLVAVLLAHAHDCVANNNKSEADDVVDVTCARVRDAVAWACAAEVRFALHWATAQPANEAACVYACAVAALQRHAVLRVLLVRHGRAHDAMRLWAQLQRHDGQAHKHSEVAAASRAHGEDDEACNLTSRQHEHNDDDDEEQQQQTTTMHVAVSWSRVYVHTLEGTMRLLQQLHTRVAPAAVAAAAAAAMTTHYEADKVLQQVHATRLLVCHALLQEIWQLCLSSAPSWRDAVHAARPWQTYVDDKDDDKSSSSSNSSSDAANATTLDALVGDVHAAWQCAVTQYEGEQQCNDTDTCDAAMAASTASSCVRLFVALEALALYEAKWLALCDTVRHKYWRRTARLLLTRSYD